ncbi:hypothetical protein TNCV_4224051, partial [Trichonephila clavipes]
CPVSYTARIAFGFRLSNGVRSHRFGKRRSTVL